MTVICDYLNITVPTAHADGVLSEILPLFSLLSLTGERFGKVLLHRTEEGGTFRFEDKDRFWMFGASGVALAKLRAAELYPSYLGAFSGVPHRVTRLDLAYDTGAPAPPILSALYNKAHSDSGVKLTRKRVLSRNIRFLKGRDPEGRDSGTLYLGARTAEVRAKVYDKRLERFQKAGELLPHHWTRYELTVTSKAGASLRDAHSPSALFWKYMTEVMGRERPSDVPEWFPCDGGYELPDKVSLLPAELLMRCLERSAEIEQWVTLADQLGPHGRAWLIKQFAGIVDGSGQADLTTDYNREANQSS